MINSGFGQANLEILNQVVAERRQADAALLGRVLERNSAAAGEPIDGAYAHQLALRFTAGFARPMVTNELNPGVPGIEQMSDPEFFRFTEATVDVMRLGGVSHATRAGTLALELADALPYFKGAKHDIYGMLILDREPMSQAGTLSRFLVRRHIAPHARGGTQLDLVARIEKPRRSFDSRP